LTREQIIASIKYMDVFSFFEKFPTEESVIQYFIQIRYPEGVTCSHCGAVKHKIYRRSSEPRVFDCKNCFNTFSIFKDTIFEKSDTDLRKWFYAIHLMLNSKKGISGYQLQREIKVTYKTAWRMLKKIREAMSNEELALFQEISEIDETYVGGKPRKQAKKDKDDDDDMPSSGNKRGRGTDKTPVIGIVNRALNKVVAKVAKLNEQGQKLSGKQLIAFIKDTVESDSTIYSDEFKGYNQVSKHGYKHERVDHTREFAYGSIHTNSIESFWAVLKRGIVGIYHHVSTKYLQLYVNEFAFRWNNRESEDMFGLVLYKAIH
jgi:transposase-like protein